MKKKIFIAAGLAVILVLGAVFILKFSSDKNKEFKKVEVISPKLIKNIKLPLKLDKNANLNLPNPAGEKENQLFEAIKNKNNTLVKSLIEQGADINAGQKGTNYTAFVVAAKSCNVEALKEIDKKNPNMTLDTSSGNSVLKSSFLNAAEEGCLDAVKYIYESKKLDINTRHNVWNETILYKAAAKNNVELAKFAMEKNVDAEIKAFNNKKAIDAAKEKGYQDIVKMIEDYSNKK